MHGSTHSPAAALPVTDSPSQAVRPMMKAVVHDVYGGYDVLGIRDIARPAVNDNDVLIRVRAAGLHVGDCFGVRGAPFLMRMVSGWLKPKRGIPGFDVAGVVEAVGRHVRRFKPGDAVFGACNGACAEYACTAQDNLAHKPVNLSFEQAAAVPTSALAALHALRDVANLRPGQKVLVNGASGGVGTFAVQIAKSIDAEVTGVCGPNNVDLVRLIGADHVIDYTRDDFVSGGRRYDLILDNVENRSLADCRRALNTDGMLILNSGTGARGIKMLVRLLKPLLLSPLVRQNLRRYLSVPSHADLAIIKDLIESDKLRPVIDRIRPMTDTPAALAYIEAGHASGKVVVAL